MSYWLPMPVTRRVYISVPMDQWLTPGEIKFKWAVIEAIRKSGYAPELFEGEKSWPMLAGNQTWSFHSAELVARRCVGGVLIGLPRWRFPAEAGELRLATEYAHYEGGLLNTLRLPVLVLADRSLTGRVVFDRASGLLINYFPPDCTAAHARTAGFKAAFGRWLQQVGDRRDIFLGYCGSSRPTALKIKAYLQKSLGATVLDWQTDFKPGATILDQIEAAERRCTAGLFLFTKDDKIAGSRDAAAPRDNVVFEAGFFAHAKGHERVLIIKEQGAKMPADLGGAIYAPLKDRADIAPVKPVLQSFVANNL